MLTDRPTLLTHREQWVTEPPPVRSRLDRLTADEHELYQALLDGDFGLSVRLEQERNGNSTGQYTEA